MSTESRKPSSGESEFFSLQPLSDIVLLEQRTRSLSDPKSSIIKTKPQIKNTLIH